MTNGISYEDYLDRYGSLTYANVGESMLPLLRQGQGLFTVEKKGGTRCKAGDVVLYRRPPSHYVLHRIIEVRDNDYIILGDNCVTREYGVTDDDILGVMTGYVRNGKRPRVDEAGYRIYTFVWMHTIPLRIAVKRMRYKVGRWLKKQ